MNVIFLDFDGVLDTKLNNTNELIEEKVKILSIITHKLNCKVVIEASIKSHINEFTLEVEGEWLNFLFSLFKKYDIDVIGRTPLIKRYYSSSSYLEVWKEDEIILYLIGHPEIEHFCVIDDDDRAYMRLESDLEKVREYLVTTKDYGISPSDEGINLEYLSDIDSILKKENKFNPKYYNSYAISLLEKIKNQILEESGLTLNDYMNLNKADREDLLEYYRYSGFPYYVKKKIKNTF